MFLTWFVKSHWNHQLQEHIFDYNVDNRMIYLFIILLLRTNKLFPFFSKWFTSSKKKHNKKESFSLEGIVSFFISCTLIGWPFSVIIPEYLHRFFKSRFCSSPSISCSSAAHPITYNLFRTGLSARYIRIHWRMDHYDDRFSVVEVVSGDPLDDSNIFDGDELDVFPSFGCASLIF